MEIGNSINTLENALRDLVETILQGTDEGRLGVSAERVSVWKLRRDEEPKRRPGGKVEERLIYYSELHDVVQVIRKNWERGFKDCFGDRKRFDVYMDRIAAFRNPDAHSRALLPFEEYLVLGITGELRQAITIYLSEGSGGPDREYFPRIEEIRDSFGNRAGGGSISYVQTNLTLRVGDTITFTGKAWDPDGDPLAWRISIGFPSRSTIDINGNEFEWQWTLRMEDVHERFRMMFRLNSSKPYHKNGDYDGLASLVYRVLPPY